ncbi:SIS domain-containing protein [Confluentibacter flavum]|uniref:Sugar isomerase n=1 Tax=Confluentibacter flavum TaxID=1909700 RepID=A0A2N3HHY8_9FLAO|nr:SIS domain-containing protein [Confluentibacter flavum]PKQ44428.1 sugar isomerase [Confluentibacter flavum]
MKSSNTELEITAQPRLWLETYSIIESQRAELTKFMNSCLPSKDLSIIMTGAGSSAYIGEVLYKYFQRNLQRETKAIPTTDLISHPADYFKENTLTLMISFARSGDSPESLEAMNLAEKICKNIFHLIITCNPNGKLTLNAKSNNSYILFMPRDANDKGLAMTGSFTTMLLAGLLVSDLNNLEKNKIYIDQLANYGNIILTKFKQKIKKIAGLSFNRIVFLGSGALKGIARESQLKVTELTNGQVIGQYDSFLGLRHGPKAVIDHNTLVVYLFSNDDFVNKYEYDLVRSINTQKEKMAEIGIVEVLKHQQEITLNLSIEVSKTNLIPEEYFAVCAVLPSQLLGLYKSINLGLSPDSPSVNKSINRVVQGVKIYHK